MKYERKYWIDFSVWVSSFVLVPLLGTGKCLHKYYSYHAYTSFSWVMIECFMSGSTDDHRNSVFFVVLLVVLKQQSRTYTMQ